MPKVIVAIFPVNAAWLKPHAKISPNGKCKRISTFRFLSLDTIVESQPAGNKCGAALPNQLSLNRVGKLALYLRSKRVS